MHPLTRDGTWPTAQVWPKQCWPLPEKEARIGGIFCWCCISRLANSWHEGCCFPQAPMPMAETTNGLCHSFPKSPNRVCSPPPREQTATTQDGNCSARRGPVPDLSCGGWLRSQAPPGDGGLLRSQATTPPIQMRNNVPPKQTSIFPLSNLHPKVYFKISELLNRQSPVLELISSPKSSMSEFIIPFTLGLLVPVSPNKSSQIPCWKP